MLAFICLRALSGIELFLSAVCFRFCFVDLGDSCLHGGAALSLAFATVPFAGPGLLYLSIDFDLTTSFVNDFGER